MIQFTVFGQAKPAGSKRAVPMGKRWGVIDANPKAGNWKREVAQVAGRAMNGNALLRGAIFAEFVFFRARPKAHLRKDGSVKPNAPTYPTTKPDLTKVVRGTEDALKGIVWADDAQVVKVGHRKEYGEPARVEIRVAELLEL